MNQHDYAERRPGMSTGQKWLIGCGISALIFVVLLGVVIVYAVNKFRSFAAETIHEGMVEMVDQSELPDEQKRRIIARLDQLHDDFQARRIGLAELSRVMEQLAQSPIFAAFMVRAADAQYIESSGLTDEEKDDARKQVERFMLGIIEKKIPQTEAEGAMEMISEPDPHNPGADRLKPTLTDDELRDFIAELERKADDAGVPDQRHEINIADEFDKVIEAALEES